MESKVAGYCAIAATLGIIAAATGFAAEATNVKASEVDIEHDTCVYPSSPAFALGFVSAVFAIITRFYITFSFGVAAAGCNSTPVSKLLFVLSWVATPVAVILLLTAAVLNIGRDVGHFDSDGDITCFVVKPGIFATGAVLALLSAIFGIASFITLPPLPQTTTPAVGVPVGANVNIEKKPAPFPPQQYHPHPQAYPQKTDKMGCDLL